MQTSEMVVNKQNKLNADGDLITAEVVGGGFTTQTIKYGLIKLMGEKTERRVSFKTICEIEQSRKAGFDGNITITELGMSVRMNQIVMLRSEYETKKIVENFAKLPTESLLLDGDINCFTMPVKSRIQHIVDGDSYWQCVVHYKLDNGVKQYFIDFKQIKRAVKIKIEDGYEVVEKIYEYGEEKIGIE